MIKPLAIPARFGIAVLAEDLADGVRRPRREITWSREPKSQPHPEDEPTAEVERP